MSETVYGKPLFPLRQRRSAFFYTWVLVTALATACGGTKKPVETGDPEKPAIKMRHQILFRFGEETHVFEGYMIHRDEAFYVKAFAGPGVDLFTVARDGERHRHQLHLSGLEDKIDLGLVEKSIARVYLPGCGAEPGIRQARCRLLGEPLEERYHADGTIAERRFEGTTDGPGPLVIRFEEYGMCATHPMARRIELSWQKADIRMVIQLVECEATEALPPNFMGF